MALLAIIQATRNGLHSRILPSRITSCNIRDIVTSSKSTFLWSSSSRTLGETKSYESGSGSLHSIVFNKSLLARSSSNLWPKKISLIVPARTMSTPSQKPATNPGKENLAPPSSPTSSALDDKQVESASAAAPAKDERSTKEKLKQAVRDYGATVIVFHVTMSLMSLGFFYLLVSSGLDVVAILEKVGIGGSILASKFTEEASKFVVAYAIHKVFAPVRITITLGVTPLIVRKLRSMGILKQAVKAKSASS